MTTLSIIVPVYNVAKYLPKCLESLLCQDLADYEIICVNDGSTDSSAEILAQYAAQYPQIQVITQPNAGLSAARNTGIKAAQGKYIQFVDSDDYLEPHTLAPLIEKMEHEYLDILRFNYQNVNEAYEVFEPYKSHKPFVDYRDEVCDGVTFLNGRLGVGCYAWQFMICTKLLRDEQNHFKTGILFEDTEWTPRILLQAQRVTSVDTIVYNYLMRQGSITQAITKEKQQKVADNQLLLIHSMQEQYAAQPLDWYKGMITHTVVALLGNVALKLYPDRKKYLQELSSMRVLPLSKYHSTTPAQRKIQLINLSPALYCWLIHIKNKLK